MSNQSRNISSIYKSRQIILQLLSNQNYYTDDYNNFDINEINALFTSNMLDMMLEKRQEDESKQEQETSKIYVHYYLGAKYNHNKIQALIDELFVIEEKLKLTDTLIIIGDNDPNDSINAIVKEIWERDKIFIIIQSIKRLQFNVLEHTLQPLFRVMSETEKNDVKRRFNITNDENFPELSRNDPAFKAIFIRPGQLCEIIRPSKTAMISVYYKLCV